MLDVFQSQLGLQYSPDVSCEMSCRCSSTSQCLQNKRLRQSGQRQYHLSWTGFTGTWMLMDKDSYAEAESSRRGSKHYLDVSQADYLVQCSSWTSMLQIDFAQSDRLLLATSVPIIAYRYSSGCSTAPNVTWLCMFSHLSKGCI